MKLCERHEPHALVHSPCSLCNRTAEDPSEATRVRCGFACKRSKLAHVATNTLPARRARCRLGRNRGAGRARRRDRADGRRDGGAQPPGGARCGAIPPLPSSAPRALRSAAAAAPAGRQIHLSAHSKESWPRCCQFEGSGMDGACVAGHAAKQQQQY
eukprot:scaffold349_cov352-Prasinococcus_capsulatus_cf.AAC.12